MSDVLKILLIEDNPGDAVLVRELLADSDTAVFDLTHAASLSEGKAQLEGAVFDGLLLDLSLPDSRGLQTFLEVRQAAPRVPVVVLSGMDDEGASVEAVHEGAQDYLVKGHVDTSGLVRAIRYAIERKRAEKEIRALNADLEHRVEERTRELAAANERLRELDRLKSAFIDLTSHELRTPVVIVGGMLRLLEKQFAEGASEAPPSLEPAMRAAQRLEKLIVRTLQVVRMEEFDAHTEQAATSVADLVGQAIEEVRPFVELRHQELTVEVSPDLPSIQVNADNIQDALINVLMNAVKFTPDDGAIDVSAKAEKGTLQVRVTDTGVGISEADLPHIFEEFFCSFETRQHASGEYEFGTRGIGLGLAVAKKFMERNGGRILVESKPGEGSTFTLEFDA